LFKEEGYWLEQGWGDVIMGAAVLGSAVTVRGIQKYDAGKVSSDTEASGVGKSEKISPYDLQKTHSQTLSKKDMADLVNDIKVNGIKEPIKYVEYNGNKYIVDGHHRTLAAKQLKLTDIPVERAELPYGGYESIQDLLWVD